MLKTSRKNILKTFSLCQGKKCNRLWHQLSLNRDYLLLTKVNYNIYMDPIDFRFYHNFLTSFDAFLVPLREESASVKSFIIEVKAILSTTDLEQDDGIKLCKILKKIVLLSADEQLQAKSMLDELLQKYSETHSGDNFLSACIQKGRCFHQAALLLIELNVAAIHLPDHQTRTPLHEAVIGKHPDLVKALCQQGADVNCLTKNTFLRVPVEGETPLTLCVENLSRDYSRDPKLYRIFSILFDEYRQVRQGEGIFLGIPCLSP